MTTTRKPATALGWFPHTPATDAAVIDMADSRQVALRVRLRNHYWLTECRPISETTVSLMRKKMVMVNASDVMQDDQVSEVLSEHYGFLQSPVGHTIPDLDEARREAAASLGRIRERASAGGKAKAAKAQSAGAAEPATSPQDF